MLTRRDLAVVLVTACVTTAAVALAQTAGVPQPVSVSIDWEKLKAEPTKTGERRAVVKMKTGTLDEFEMHVTTVGPGLRSHEPHRHPEEELIIVKEGTVESMQNGETVRLGPGSVIFEGSNELHGVANVGDTPATYYVIKFYPPGLATH